MHLNQNTERKLWQVHGGLISIRVQARLGNKRECLRVADRLINNPELFNFQYMRVPERLEQYYRILYTGLVEIKKAAEKSDFKRCWKEANHLHNIPQLLSDFDNEEGHDFYWNYMRHDESSTYAKPFINLWAKLKELK